ncbi:MAG: DUF5671 domain-containing protein [Candidatus Paceibacterota bacterium]|jgi:hypothetical protein
MNTKTTARDFFLNLGVVITLYVSIVSLLSLVFDIVNKLFPDALSYYGDSYSYGMRMAVASLIVIFPLFLWLSSLVRRDIAADPSRREVAARRFLTWITLFVSGAAVATDLVVLLNTFLSGEVTMRFVLKVLAVLIVAGATLAYYINEVRDVPKRLSHKTIFALSSALVVVAIVSSFFVFGSPMTVRKERMDDRRISDLQSIQWQIVNYWQQKGTLPATIADLEDPISGFYVPTDPDTDEAYVYEKSSARAFKLCADFSLGSSSDQSQKDMSYTYPAGLRNESWKHEAGKHCFDRTIDPELYPVRPKY